MLPTNKGRKRTGSSFLRIGLILLVLVVATTHYTNFHFVDTLHDHHTNQSPIHETTLRGAIPAPPAVATASQKRHLGVPLTTTQRAEPRPPPPFVQNEAIRTLTPPIVAEAKPAPVERTPKLSAPAGTTTKPEMSPAKVEDSPEDQLGNDDEESYYVVFSTGCSEFQDWQSIGVYSSAERVKQKGIVTRIASGCTPSQEVVIRHAMSHLPKRCRVHFAPNTQVKDHSGKVYKYANKPLGMMHWLNHARPPVPPTSTVALIDPDMFFLRPLWHDSFDAPSKFIVTGPAKASSVPKRIVKGTMVAQQYGIGGAPWQKGPGRKAKAWDLHDFFTNEAGRPNSPALDSDLNANTAGTWFSIGAPYIALAEDWLPISTNWTHLMPMAVERNYGNLAEMYAMVIAVADLGIRPARIDNMMVSNVGAGGEGWPWVDTLPTDRGCDPSILTDPSFPLPTFLHYCQRYEISSLKSAAAAAGLGGQGQHGNSAVSDPKGAHWMFTKYQVPDEILQCPAGSQASEGISGVGAGKGGGGSASKMKLGPDGLLPEPPIHIEAGSKNAMRNIFSHCLATRATNQAAKDYRRWFCDGKH